MRGGGGHVGFPHFWSTYPCLCAIILQRKCISRARPAQRRLSPVACRCLSYLHRPPHPVPSPPSTCLRAVLLHMRRGRGCSSVTEQKREVTVLAATGEKYLACSLDNTGVFSTVKKVTKGVLKSLNLATVAKLAKLILLYCTRSS